MHSSTSSTYFDRQVDSLGYYRGIRYSSMQRINNRYKMEGVPRVIIFCCLIVIVPSILIITPLYLRHTVFADVVFPVTESDIIEIHDGISNIFCEQHSLRMNSSFNAFQLKTRPEVSGNHKHIRLKKSMILPDDTLEYWGFYLLKGARVELKVCSHYEGSRILVVKGERNLKTCGLLEHNRNKVGAHFARGYEKVNITFETAAEVVISDERNYYGRAYADQQNIHQTKNSDEVQNHGGEESDESAENDSIQNDQRSLGHGEPKSLVSKSQLKKERVFNDKPEKASKQEDESESKDTDSPENASESKENESGNPKTPKRRHNRHAPNLKRHAPKGIYQSTNKHPHDPLARVKRKKHKRDVNLVQDYHLKISHGGNAGNFSDKDSGSISSFENSLLTCYDGEILLAKGFDPSHQCTGVEYFETGRHMMSKHDVVEDGYYYYIFYSDNDIVRNEIHAVFDIYKPTFEYANLSDALVCLNSTNCTFPIRFTSEEIVVVEVPTRDGIEHEEDDVTYLISTCHPRVAIYMIFPISVLVLILSCSFI